MEYIPHITAVVAVLVSVVSFFKSNSKDQSLTDKKQDEMISGMKADIKVLYERTGRQEGRLDSFENRVGSEILKLENKIDELPNKIIRLMKGI